MTATKPCEIYLVYNGITMVSNLETNLFIFLRNDFLCLEVVCHIRGINEEVVYLYLDLAKLSPFIPADHGLTAEQTEKRKSILLSTVVIDGLLLTTHPTNPFAWCFTIRSDYKLESIAAPKAEDMGRKRAVTTLWVNSTIISKPNGLEPFDLNKKLYKVLENEELDHFLSTVTKSFGPSQLPTTLSGRNQSRRGSALLGKDWLQSTTESQRLSPETTVDLATSSTDSNWERMYSQRVFESNLPQISSSNKFSLPAEIASVVNTRASVSLPALSPTRTVSFASPTPSPPSPKHVYDFLLSKYPSSSAKINVFSTEINSPVMLHALPSSASTSSTCLTPPLTDRPHTKKRKTRSKTFGLNQPLDPLSRADRKSFSFDPAGRPASVGKGRSFNGATQRNASILEALEFVNKQTKNVSFK